MRLLKRLWLRLLPGHLYYADELTSSGKRLLVRIVIGGVGVASSGLAIVMIGSSAWREVVAGAVLAWGVSLIIWAFSSYRQTDSDTYAKIRRTAEVDLLHARLNQISAWLGLPTLNLDWELEAALAERTERLAHYAGLDEYRPRALANAPQSQFWDEMAMGRIETAADDDIDSDE